MSARRCAMYQRRCVRTVSESQLNSKLNEMKLTEEEVEACMADPLAAAELTGEG